MKRVCECRVMYIMLTLLSTNIIMYAKKLYFNIITIKCQKKKKYWNNNLQPKYNT